MKLWKLYKQDGVDGPWGWDCFFGFVVRAEDELAARTLASETSYGFEGKLVWLDESMTSCVELQAEGEPEVILSDYNAG